MGVSTKSFAAADEVRTPSKTRVEVVNLGSAKAGRFTMQPGWRWSECIKPVAGTESCRSRHVGVVVSGHLHVVTDDGGEADLRAGDAYVIDPGHDAWVVGDEQWSSYEFESVTADTYAKG